ncbi:MAG: PIN domain-containing protein [Gemmatimonadota bacterium]
MTVARSFLDTNVLVYTDDEESPDKQRTALRLVESVRLEGSGVVSTQVLQEYFVASTRKLGVPPEIARRKTELFARLDIVVLDLQHILGAIDLHRLHRLSFWDALVLRAAADAGCTVLYSEDLNAGQGIEGVEVVNPFAG